MWKWYTSMCLKTWKFSHQTTNPQTNPRHLTQVLVGIVTGKEQDPMKIQIRSFSNDVQTHTTGLLQLSNVRVVWLWWSHMSENHDMKWHLQQHTDLSEQAFTQKRKNTVAISRHFVDCTGQAWIQLAWTSCLCSVVATDAYGSQPDWTSCYATFCPSFPDWVSQQWPFATSNSKKEERVKVCQFFLKCFQKQLWDVIYDKDWIWISYDRLFIYISSHYALQLSDVNIGPICLFWLIEVRVQACLATIFKWPHQCFSLTHHIGQPRFE